DRARASQQDLAEPDFRLGQGAADGHPRRKGHVIPGEHDGDLRLGRLAEGPKSAFRLQARTEPGPAPVAKRRPLTGTPSRTSGESRVGADPLNVVLGSKIQT